MTDNVMLILGGARSGKSAYAEQVAAKQGRPMLYVATGAALDAEMAARIRAHQSRRGDSWTIVEAPVDIAGVITNPAHANSILLVDCLTLWLSNLMHWHLSIETSTNILINALTFTRAQVILVSNEVGHGIVPMNKMARQFCDQAGLLHQRVAAVAGRVSFVTAGIPMILKGKA